MFKNILVVMDGTTSEDKISLMMSKLAGTKLTLVYHVNSGWSGILGDEWMSNPWTREDFFKYMSKKQLQEAESILYSIGQKAVKLNIRLKTAVKAGSLKNIIESLNKNAEYDAVIMAADISKNKAAKICKLLPCPIFMGPL